MPRFSLRTLLGLVLIAALAMGAFMRFNTQPAFSGLSSDIGGGYGHAFYAEDSEGNVLGRLHIEITESMIAKQPEWRPTSANPPISARRALSIADNFRQTRFRELDLVQWSLTSVALTPLDLKSNKWCWVVNFELTSKPGINASGLWPEFFVYVMMDGSVIEPDDRYGYLTDRNVRESAKGGHR